MVLKMSRSSGSLFSFSAGEIGVFLEQHNNGAVEQGRGPETYLGVVLLRGTGWNWASESWNTGRASSGRDTDGFEYEIAWTLTHSGSQIFQGWQPRGLNK